MTTSITAHGKTFPTRQDALNRIWDLEKTNREIGDSDGRVTEINAIREALAETLPARSVLAAPTAEEREAATRLARNIRRAQQELDSLETIEYQEGRIQYQDRGTGNIRVSRYKTRNGFLRSYISMASNPGRYYLMFVDEN